MARQARVERSPQRPALLCHVVEQLFVPYRALHGERCGTCDRVPQIGVAVLQKAAPAAYGIVELARYQGRPDGLVAASQPFRDHDHVGQHAFIAVGEQGTRPAHAAHDLVEYQQHAVASADLPDAAEIPRHGGNGPHSRARDRLRDRPAHPAAARLEDRLLELIRHAYPVLLLALAFLAIAIRIARRDVPGADQQRPELGAAPGVAANRERAERIAVIALAAPDEMRTVPLSDLQVIL